MELDEIDGEMDAMFFNSTDGNMTHSMFVTPFSVLFYRSVFIVIYSIIFTVCIVGNLMVLFVTTASARMKTRTYFFLANLAAADLCVGVLCIIPNLLMFLYPSWILGQVICKLYYFTESFSFCASVLLLAVIALERYIAVMHPLKARSLFTKCRVHLIQVSIWTVAAGYNIPLLVIFDTETLGGVTFCFIHDHNVINMRSYYTITFVLWYALPLFTICFVYILIAWTLWHSDSLFGFSSADNRSGSMRKTLITSARTDKSKIESSSSDSNNSEYSNDPVSSRAGQKKGKCAKRTDNGTTCFCCHGCGDNASMAGDSKSDTNSGSPYPSTVRGSNTTAQGGPDVHCWSWQTANSHCSSSRQSVQRVTPSPKRPALPSTGTSYELACLNPHCKQNNRQAYFLHGFHQRYQNLRQNSTSVDRQESPKSNLSAHSTMSLRVLNSRRRVVRLLVMVVITFAVCVLPHHVRLLMHHWNVYPTSSFEMSFFPPVAFICLYLNSALNPVLYSMFSQSFRRSLKECFRKPWHRWRSFLSQRELMRWRKQQSNLSLRVSKV